MAKPKYDEWLTEDGQLKLEAWARDGLTDDQIAHNMGINVGTLYRYKNDHSRICDALKRGKQVVDILVENALFKRAIGYSYDERKEETFADGSKKETITTKHVNPDVTAQIFWLKNRKTFEWRDRKEIDHSGSIDNSVVININPDDDNGDGSK